MKGVTSLSSNSRIMSSSNKIEVTSLGTTWTNNRSELAIDSGSHIFVPDGASSIPANVSPMQQMTEDQIFNSRVPPTVLDAPVSEPRHIFHRQSGPVIKHTHCPMLHGAHFRQPRKLLVFVDMLSVDLLSFTCPYKTCLTTRTPVGTKIATKTRPSC